MTLPVAYVAHASMARVRIRVPSRRHDTAYFSTVVEKLSARPEVISVEGNAATTGLLVRHYCPLPRLFALAADEGLFAPGGEMPAAGRAGFANAEFDLARAVVPLLLGLSALQAVRGSVLGPAAGLLSLALAIGDRRRMPGAGDPDGRA
jgi:hypothetical protein